MPYMYDMLRVDVIDALLTRRTATRPARAAETISFERGLSTRSSGCKVWLVAASVKNALTSEN